MRKFKKILGIIVLLAAMLAFSVQPAAAIEFDVESTYNSIFIVHSRNSLMTHLQIYLLKIQKKVTHLTKIFQILKVMVTRRILLVNDYIGKICPFCKTEFQANDEIVVCSVCDMPHHKDCWIENQGCTTFGCLGTVKAADGTPSVVTSTTMQYDDDAVASTVYCTRCGSANSSESLFCSKCGNQLKAAPQSHSEPNFVPAVGSQSFGTPSNQQQNYYSSTYQSASSSYGAYNGNSTVDSETSIYIGTKSEYYIPKFTELKTQNKKNSWNWSAFLVAPYWMIYRKMYGYGAGVLAATFILSLLGTLGSLLSIGGYIAAGIFANYLYMQQTEKNILHGKSMSEPYKSQHISKVSGVNTTATVLAVIGYVILILIV